MLTCHRAQLEGWKPDFSSSGQSDPSWIRVRCGDTLLSNALNWIDWTEDPVQVVLCEACGTSGCEEGGYIHLSRVGDTVLWSTPPPEAAPEGRDAAQAVSAAVRRFGAVAIPSEEWSRWRRRTPSIPALEAIEAAKGRTLADAWRLSTLGANRVDRLADLVPMLRERMLAADHLEPSEAIAAIERLVAWLEQRAGVVLHGHFETPEAAAAAVETLHFKGPRVLQWPALALRGQEELLAFGVDCVFVPGQARS